MSLKITVAILAHAARLAVAPLLVGSLFWSSQAQAQERLPWETGQRAPAGNYDRAGTKLAQSQSDRYAQAGRYPSDTYAARDDYQAPVIRQPRSAPAYDPGYDNEDRRPRSYSPRPAPAYRQAAPYRSEYADPPRYPSRSANYDRGYDDRRYAPPPRYYEDQSRYDRRYDRRNDYAPDRGPSGSYSMDEILSAGGSFFGSVSKGLASVIEYAFKSQGRPNGYILGEGAGGAFIAGLRYGEGTLYTKSAGQHKVYWQGPSIGYDAGAEGSKTMVLVYNLRRPKQIYHRFAGVSGSAYLVGGVGINFQKRKDVVLAPIRAGVGLRLGANIGYLKYTRRPTWNPF